MSLTARRKNPYPELTDGPDGANVPYWVALLAQALDTAPIDDQGTLANRPVSTPGAPGIIGRLYTVKGDPDPAQNNKTYRDHGTGWDLVSVDTASINQVGLFAARPLATAVTAGTRYFATDQVAEYISDGAAWTRVSLPAGITADWFKPDAAVPTGWVKYDGANLPASTGIYADLYVHLGSTVTTPDTRGRTIVGQGTHTDVDAIGENEGLAVGARRPKHKTSITDPGHVHSTPTSESASAPSATGNLAAMPVTADGSTGSATTGITAGPQTGNEPTDTPAYIVALKIAKL